MLQTYEYFVTFLTCSWTPFKQAMASRIVPCISYVSSNAFLMFICFRYSRREITEWLQSHDTSPSHGGKLPNKTLVRMSHFLSSKRDLGCECFEAGAQHGDAEEGRRLAETAPDVRAVGIGAVAVVADAICGCCFCFYDDELQPSVQPLLFITGFVFIVDL